MDFPDFWFIQTIGAIALVFVIFSWNAKRRRNIFLLQTINLILFTVHYLFLSAYAGAGMCLVVIARNLVFMQKGEQEWASHWAWFYFFTLMAIGVLVVSWNGLTTTLPVIAVVMSMYAMWKDQPSQMRFFMLLSCLIWIPYTIIVQSYPGLLSQVVGIVAILTGMYRLDATWFTTPFSKKG